MNLKLQITLWMLIFLMLYCGTDSIHFNWTSVLPHFNRLCPSLRGCSDSDAAGEDMESLTENPCCKESPCETDRSVPEDQNALKGLTTCLEASKISDLELVKIKFVTDPPHDGCVRALLHTGSPKPSCNPDVMAAPWGNFYPVYSFDKQINFINENCARCHGATNIIKWRAFVLYKKEAITGLLTTDNNHETFNSSQTIISFEPPDKDSVGYTDICFDVIDTCYPDFKDIFDIPRTVNMTRSEIVEACEEGPTALYVVNFQAGLKNVFCALCNSFYSAEKDSVECDSADRYADNRGPTDTFATLLSADYIDARTQESTLPLKNIPKACHSQMNESDDQVCRDVVCPSLQARYPDGKCDYPSEFLYVNKVIVSLNLSVIGHAQQENVSNMSGNAIKLLFQRFFPWPSIWKIILVTKRADNTGDNTPEFGVVIGYDTNGFVKTKEFLRYSLSALSRKWPIKHLDGRTVFTQEFMQHGNYGAPDRKTKLIRPSWATNTRNDPFKSNISSPSWELLYSGIEAFYGRSPKTIIYLTKLFYCNQIELREDEYKASLRYSPLYLIHTKTYLFPGDYHRYSNEDGKQVVIICLEDSSFVLADFRNAAQSIKITDWYAIGLFFLLWIVYITHLPFSSHNSD